MSFYVISVGFIILLAIIAPFLSKKTKDKGSVSYVKEWEQERELIFSQLSDLEYDYRMAKISEHDYKQAKADLSAKAAIYTNGSQQVEEEVEQEVDQEITAYLQKHSRVTTGQGGVSHEH